MGEREKRPVQFEEGLRWYAIRIKHGREKVVENGFRELKLEVFLPWINLRRRLGSRFQWVLVPLFPGYLFCRLDLVLSGKAARYSPGVKDFVKFGDRIADVADEVVRALMDRCPGGVAEIRVRPYRAGESIIIREGPLSGLEAVFEREMGGNERVAVLLELLGRQTRLVLSREMIARV